MTPGLWTGMVASAGGLPVGSRGLFIGTTVRYVNIDVRSNASTFGTSRGGSACASATRCVLSGGGGTYGDYPNYIDYLTFATLGNYSAFGNLLRSAYAVRACSSPTRGVVGWGGLGPWGIDNLVKNMDYFTIATTGNSASFGNLSRTGCNGTAIGNATRGLFTFGRGYSGGYEYPNRQIDYISFATTGDSASFGNLYNSESLSLSRCASSTRVVWGSGYFEYIQGETNMYWLTNAMTYSTFATAGDSVNFGNMSRQKYATAGCSSATRGIFCGGYNGSYCSEIDEITIATTGNATSFGDLTVATAGDASAINFN